MTLGIDIDGVLASFNKGYWGHLTDVHGTNLVPEGEDIDNPPCWEWETHWGYPPEVTAEVWKERIIANTEFWLTLEPLPEATAVCKVLNRLCNQKHDVYFLTHRMGKKAKRQTEKWLYELGIDYPTAIMVDSKDKAGLVKVLGIEFFIDDKLETVQAVHRECPATRAYLKDAAYNRADRWAGMRVVPSVKAALEDVGLWNH